MKNEQMTVEVIDAIMGSGKTYDAIQRMKSSERSFLYVTPFLSEVKRVIDQVPLAYEPLVTSDYEINGERRVNYKRDSLLHMANVQKNLVTTHSLFSRLHSKDYKYFENYDLILDEVLTPIKLIKMTLDDIKIAFNEGLLVLNERTGEVSFVGDNYHGKFYADLKQYCDTSNVIFVNDRLLVWSFPPEIFKCFNSVTVLTYLFEGSLLSSYFRYYNIPYKINRNSPEIEGEIKNRIRNLLNVYEGPCNKLGDNPTAFSVNWLKRRSSQDFKRIKTTVANLLERNFKSKSRDTAFTTYKEFSPKLKGKGYAKGFLVVNERATNKYSHKESMIYLANRYVNPNILEFFRGGAVVVDEDNWALAELLQWVWRGAIRDNKPMNLFIPSKRMRELLQKWLNSNCSDKVSKFCKAA